MKQRIVENCTQNRMCFHGDNRRQKMTTEAYYSTYCVVDGWRMLAVTVFQMVLTSVRDERVQQQLQQMMVVTMMMMATVEGDAMLSIRPTRRTCRPALR
jgi:hypothetical protein